LDLKRFFDFDRFNFLDFERADTLDFERLEFFDFLIAILKRLRETMFLEQGI